MLECILSCIEYIVIHTSLLIAWAKRMDDVVEIFHFGSYAPEPGYTPVRRRDQVLQDVSPTNSVNAPWTATRCNRLLRPLSSRLALLRKHKQHRVLPAQSTCQPNKIILTSTSNHSETTLEIRSSYQKRERDEDDPEWSPAQAKKRLKRTYSTRGLSHNMKNNDCQKGRPLCQQGVDMKIHVPMCDLQRQTNSADLAGDEQISSQSGQDDSNSSQQTSTEEASASQMRSSQNSTRESFRRLAKTSSPSEWMLIDGLYSGLDALLKATARRRPLKSTGTRSLFATCLRKVPQYIAMEEHLAAEEDPESSTDISSAIYCDLEDYGCFQSGGWKPLREVVRAHGIAILGNAIADGTMSLPIARGLVILCLQASAIDEAVDLCDYLLKTMTPLAKPKSLFDRLFGSETSIALQTLYDISAQSERWAYYYRSINTLLQSGLIPIEWIATHGMIECCNRVTRSITQQDANVAEAEALLEATMSLVCTESATGGLPSINTGLTNTISNFITVLLSVDIVRHESGISVNPQSNKSISIIATLASKTRQACTPATLRALLQGGSSAQVARICIPVLAEYLITGPRIQTYSIEMILEAIYTTSNTEIKQKTIDVLASFICSTAQCCAQAGSRTAFDYIQDMVAKLALRRPATTSSIDVREPMADIALQAAFEFSEQTSQRAHLDWALEIEEATESLLPSSRNTTIAGRTPKREPSQPGAGFRWEEGICEWVARSPQSLLPQESTTQSSPEEKETLSKSLDSSASLPSRTSHCADLSAPPPPLRKPTTMPPRPRGRPRGRPKRPPACGIQILVDRPTHTDIKVNRVNTRCDPCAVERSLDGRWKAGGKDGDDDELCTVEQEEQESVVLKELRNPSGFKKGVKASRGSRPCGGSLPQWGTRLRLGRGCASLGGEGSEDELGI